MKTLSLIFTLTLSLPLSFCCLNDNKKDKSGISSTLLNCIKSIKQELPLELLQEKNVFFDIYMYERNDSNFWAISPSFAPPILSNSNNKIGFIKIDNDYLLFFGHTMDNTVYDTDRVSTKWELLYQIPVETDFIYDGYTYIYFINKQLTKPILIQRYQY